MEREYIGDRVPEKLVDRLESRLDERLRRRVVLTKGNDRWQLVCCTVEGFLPGEPMPDPVPARRYPRAILYEDFLTGAECLAFANELQTGRAVFLGGVELTRSQNTQWSVEIVSVNNDHMIRTGHVISVNFTEARPRSAATTLLAPELPYYPDIDAAARDWLPFIVYHGEGDTRNDRVVFLLPETRAFVAEAVLAGGHGTIDITVSGSEARTLPLMIKGAYWQGKVIRHLDAAIKDCKATLAVPADADRLEYYLIDSGGKIYDFHREDRYSRLDPSKSKLGSVKRTLTDQVRDACARDEGLHIEFKPFIAPEQRLGTPTQKTKLREVVATVVAFANTEGGHLYLGIEDDCTITGVNADLQSWVNDAAGKGAVDDAAISKYLSALKSRIKEAVNGDVTLRLEHTKVGDAIVVVIEVPKAAQRPLSIQDDQYLYVRIGHKTRKLPPDQWANFLM